MKSDRLLFLILLGLVFALTGLAVVAACTGNNDCAGCRDHYGSGTASSCYHAPIASPTIYYRSVYGSGWYYPARYYYSSCPTYYQQYYYPRISYCRDWQGC